MKLSIIFYWAGDVYYWYGKWLFPSTPSPGDTLNMRSFLDDNLIKADCEDIELKPAFILDRSVRFRNGYRNVIVLKKMTFPNDKVLSLELSEKQISGRTISLTLDYEDVLSADSFDTLLLKEQ